MFHNKLLFALFVVSSLCIAGAKLMYSPTVFSFLNVCNQILSISEDLVLNLEVNETTDIRNCHTVVEADVTNNRLLLQVLAIHLPIGQDCHKTSLHITGIDGEKETGVNLQCVQNGSLPAYNSSGQSLRLSFLSSQHARELANTSVSLLLSSFHTQINGDCQPYEFTCSNSLCIDADMTCNGYNDCADSSDEKRGCHASNANHIRMVAIVTGSLIGGIFLVVVTVACYFKIRRAHAKEGKYLPIE